MKRKQAACYFFYVFLILTPKVGSADLGALAGKCDGCHGEAGVSRWSDMPSIAGIDAFVHSEALFTYRDQARPCADSDYRTGDTGRPATNMCDVAASLSDDEIEALAEHYSGLDFVPAPQEFSAEFAAAGAAIHERDCALCHTDGGSNQLDEASILAGQWTGYLERAFEEYRSGERDQLPRMQETIDALSDEDVEALLNYYASQQ